MKIDELIQELEEIQEEHGNIRVKAGGTEKLVEDIVIDSYETDWLSVKETLCLIASFD